MFTFALITYYNIYNSYAQTARAMSSRRFLFTRTSALCR